MEALVLAIKALDLHIGYIDEETGGVFWAVRGINLEVEEGSSFCLVGESGSGKSTMAYAMAGILPPHAVTHGKLFIYDQPVIYGPVQNYNGVRGRIVSLIPQNPGTGLNPFFTIEDHFYYVLRDLKGLSKKESRKIAIDHLERVGLDPSILDYYPHELSGGMQQRVAIAIALASDVKILVADEPTSAVDANLRYQLLQLISELIRVYRLTLFMVTHDIMLASKICDVIGVMYSGELLEYGRGIDIVKNPRHPYTINLVNSIPVPGIKKPLRVALGEPEYFNGEERCAFYNRCPYRQDRCRMKPPHMEVPGEPLHYTRCWRYLELVF